MDVTTQRQLTVGRDDRFYGNSPYYETKFTGFDDIIEGLLFRFSVRLGAVLTYLLIQAMNPVTIRQPIHKEDVNSARRIKDYFVERWVKNIMSPVEMINVLRKSFEDPGYYVTLDEGQKFANISSYEPSKV